MSDIFVQVLKKGRYKLFKNIKLVGNEQTFEMQAGYISDFASTPRFLWWLLPPNGTYVRAALFHDLFWQMSIAAYEQGEKFDGTLKINGSTQQYPLSYVLDAVDVDALFLKVMKEDGTLFPVRWAMWAAVRSAAILQRRIGSMKPSDWLKLGAVYASLASSTGILALLAKTVIETIF